MFILLEHMPTKNKIRETDHLKWSLFFFPEPYNQLFHGSLKYDHFQISAASNSDTHLIVSKASAV